MCRLFIVAAAAALCWRCFCCVAVPHEYRRLWKWVTQILAGNIKDILKIDIHLFRCIYEYIHNTNIWNDKVPCACSLARPRNQTKHCNLCCSSAYFTAAITIIIVQNIEYSIPLPIAVWCFEPTNAQKLTVFFSSSTITLLNCSHNSIFIVAIQNYYWL